VGWGEKRRFVVSWGKRNAVVPMPIRPRARRERGSGSGRVVDILGVLFFSFFGWEEDWSWEIDDEKDLEVDVSERY
jgi:hypothetical protein